MALAIKTGPIDGKYKKLAGNRWILDEILRKNHRTGKVKNSYCTGIYQIYAGKAINSYESQL